MGLIQVLMEKESQPPPHPHSTSFSLLRVTLSITLLLDFWHTADQANWVEAIGLYLYKRRIFD